MIEHNLRIDLIHDGGLGSEGYQALGFYQLPRVHARPIAEEDQRGDYRWLLLTRGGDLVASGAYSPLFGEWQSTLKPGDVDAQQRFRECLVVPHVPEGQVVIERRSALQGWRKVAIVHIPKETDRGFAPRGVQTAPLWQGGDAARCVNIVFVSEGYTNKEHEQFLEDARRASDLLLSSASYAPHKASLNTTAIFKPTRYGGIPLSEKEDATNTNFDTSYGALHMDRYMAVRDPHALYEAIGELPADAVVVLCNSEKYGGCGLFGQHCALPARIEPAVFEYLLLHEFGHTFAGLGDEYFDSGVTYTAEWLATNPPWEPNVSPLVDGKVRWQAKIAADVPVPTPWRKDEYVTLAKQARDAREHVEPDSATKVDIDGFLRNEPYYGKLGAFEGARYTAEGLYRPEVDCRMFSKTAKHFCSICNDTIGAAIKRVIS